MTESYDPPPGVPSFHERANATTILPGQKIQLAVTDRLRSPLISHEVGQNCF